MYYATVEELPNGITLIIWLYVGRKFYTWLESWNWDHSSLPDDPREHCLNRYAANNSTNGGVNLTIDACACDAIVTDCHVNAVSLGTGQAENSAPFNVFNSAGVYRPPEAAADRKEWWNAASKEFAWRHECVFATSDRLLKRNRLGLCCSCICSRVKTVSSLMDKRKNAWVQSSTVQVSKTGRE